MFEELLVKKLVLELHQLLHRNTMRVIPLLTFVVLVRIKM